jgi:hypothetical protein
MWLNMPILGIVASSISGNLTSYESIATVTVGAGGTSSITFTGIPSTYKHLQIRGISQGSGIASNGMQFNGDGTSNYNAHYFYGDGVTTASGFQASTSMYAFLTTASSATNIYGGFVIDILDYADTNKFKTFKSLTGGDQNGLGYMEQLSGAWRSTSAISSITMFAYSSVLSQHSTFALYGIKG